jgi:hypothetical protein
MGDIQLAISLCLLRFVFLNIFQGPIADPAFWRSVMRDAGVA